jgi:hypothetical protein
LAQLDRPCHRLRSGDRCVRPRQVTSMSEWWRHRYGEATELLTTTRSPDLATVAHGRVFTTLPRCRAR